MTDKFQIYLQDSTLRKLFVPRGHAVFQKLRRLCLIRTCEEPPTSCGAANVFVLVPHVLQKDLFPEDFCFQWSNVRKGFYSRNRWKIGILKSNWWFPTNYVWTLETSIDGTCGHVWGVKTLQRPLSKCPKLYLMPKTISNAATQIATPLSSTSPSLEPNWLRRSRFRMVWLMLLPPAWCFLHGNLLIQTPEPGLALWRPRRHTRWRPTKGGQSRPRETQEALHQPECDLLAATMT